MQNGDRVSVIGYRFSTKKYAAGALAVILVAALFVASEVRASRDPCRVTSRRYGNLIVTVFNTTCHSLTPYYWRDGGMGITRGEANTRLRRQGIVPLAIITGGFNTNRPGFREPIDFVEIEGKVIVGRSDYWPILFESKTESGKAYLGIVSGRVINWEWRGNRWQPIFKDLPRERRWAIAAGPWIKIKNGNDRNGRPEFIVQFFGNEPSDMPWVEFTYRRVGSKLVLVKTVRYKNKWEKDQWRLMFHWPPRRAVFLNKTGEVFAIISGGASDAESLGRLMVMLGYSQALMMDGGSATLPKTKNPVYLVVTKK